MQLYEMFNKINYFERRYPTTDENRCLIRIYCLEYYLFELLKLIDSEFYKSQINIIREKIADLNIKLDQAYKAISSKRDVKKKMINDGFINHHFINIWKLHDEALIDIFIAEGADIDHCYLEPMGGNHMKERSAIRNAVENREFNILKKLIACGAEVRNICLIQAIYNNDLPMTKLLIQHGANLVSSETPLMYACKGEQECSFELMRLLLTETQKKQGINLVCFGRVDLNDRKVEPQRKKTSRKIRVHYDSDDESDNDKENDKVFLEYSALTLALLNLRNNDNMNVIKSLLEHGAEFRDIDCAIIADNEIKIFDKLIKANIQFSAVQLSKLLILSYRAQNDDDTEVTKDVFTGLYFKVMACCEKRGINLAENLISNGLEPVDAHILANDEQWMKKFAATKGSVSTDITEKASAFLKAMFYNKVNMVNILLEENPNLVNIAHSDGEYPILIAASMNNLPLMEALLKYNPNVNVTQKDAEKASKEYLEVTALTLAISNNNTGMVDALLDAEGIVIPKNIMRLVSPYANSDIKKYFDEIQQRNQINALSHEVKKSIAEFRRRGQTLFSIGNNKKANKLEEALTFTNKHKFRSDTMDGFMDIQAPNGNSIRKAFAHHRIGFFGKSESQMKIEHYVHIHQMHR